MYVMILSVLLSLVLIVVALIFSTKLHYLNKNKIFECGIENSFIVHDMFSVHFYIIALIFVMFDIEILFLFNLLNKSNIIIFQWWFMFMCVFISFMFTTLIIEWKWENIKWSISKY